MNIYLVIILSVLAGEYILNIVIDGLNLRCASDRLPNEFKNYYDDKKYAASQMYLRDRARFSMAEDTFFTSVIIAFILIGGFNLVDEMARGFGFREVGSGLIFAAILMLGYRILSIPFSAYSTFVIEEKYGFNRTTIKTFIFDVIKSIVLTFIIGGIAFGGVIWFFYTIKTFAWVWCWIGVTLFELFIMFIAPVLILPLFNKFVPLEPAGKEGELRSSIEQYASVENFKMKGIFKMDASKRSSKSNAFFIGFGNNRRIVLFDTLIIKHTVDELISVLAHEIGHYKKKHILKRLLISVITTGIMFFILSFFISNRGLFSAFKMEQLSIYAGLVFFGFLYAPINMIFSVFGNIVSRRHEYEADRYAVSTHKKPQAFISALKKLTVDNLSNLTPHRFKVFLQYSHPPVLMRIEAIRKMRF